MLLILLSNQLGIMVCDQFNGAITGAFGSVDRACLGALLLREPDTP
jgi:hypothetical protein